MPPLMPKKNHEPLWRRTLGNGAVTGRFRLDPVLPRNKTTSSKPREAWNDRILFETPNTHYYNSCERCYRLKRKCLRELPECASCIKTKMLCVYVDRSQKRRKRDDKEPTSGAGDTVESKDATNIAKEDTQSTPKEANQSETPAGSSDSSLANASEDSAPPQSPNVPTTSDERAVEFRFVEPHPQSISHQHSTLNDNSRASPRARNSRLSVSLLISTDDRQSKNHVCRQIKRQVMKPLLQSSIREEFTTLAAIEDIELPKVWLMNYWENFGHTYPFVNLDEAREQLLKIDFQSELIIPFDIYLILAIGSITYDSRTLLEGDDKLSFEKYFSLDTIELMVEFLNLGMASPDHPSTIDNLRILLLLAVYAVVLLNETQLWNWVGILCRSVLRLGLYRSLLTFFNRVWWSVYNLDKQTLVLMNSPSGLLDPKFVNQKFPIEVRLWPDEDLDMVNQEIARHQLLGDLLLPMLVPEVPADTNEFSLRLELWRKGATACIHRRATNVEYATAMVNIDYYYMCTEIDQLSPLELLQFTLHFLLNLFRLAIREESLAKHQIKQLLLLFWYLKFFKVVDNFLTLLRQLVALDLNRVDLGVKLTEYVLILLVMLNLLKYMVENHDIMEARLAKLVTQLTEVNAKILIINVMTTEGMAALRSLNDEVRKPVT